MFQVANVPRLALNSLIVTGTTVALVLLLASLAAYAFARLDFVLKETIFVVFLLGLMLQAAAIIVPLYQVNNALQLLNTHLSMIGPYTALGLPFAILILRGFFEELPKELEDAARVDGASRLTIYWRIMLPLTRPALTTVGIFIGLGTWNDFLLPDDLHDQSRHADASPGPVVIRAQRVVAPAGATIRPDRHHDAARRDPVRGPAAAVHPGTDHRRREGLNDRELPRDTPLSSGTLEESLALR